MSSPRSPLASVLLPVLVLGALLTGCHEAGQTEIARGNVLASRRQFDQAAEAYRAAAQAAPGKARPRELLGHLLSDQGKRAEARAAYEDALRVEPQAALEAELGLARLDAGEGRLDDAISRLDKVIQRHPDNLYALLSRANLAMLRGKPGDPDLAVTDTAKAMAIEARSEPVLYARGRAFIAAGRMDEAAQTFELLRKAHPRSHLPAYGEARLAAARGDKAATLEKLKQARQRATESGLWRPEEVKADPAFRALREDPEFAAAVDGP